MEKLQPWQEGMWKLLSSGVKLEIDSFNMANRRGKSRAYNMALDHAKLHGVLVRTQTLDGFKTETYRIDDKEIAFYSPVQ